MKVLRIVNSITHASAPYHQFTLPLVDTQDITICAYFDSVLQPHPNLDYYQAEGRLGNNLASAKLPLIFALYDFPLTPYNYLNSDLVISSTS